MTAPLQLRYEETTYPDDISYWHRIMTYTTPPPPSPPYNGDTSLCSPLSLRRGHVQSVWGGTARGQNAWSVQTTSCSVVPVHLEAGSIVRGHLTRWGGKGSREVSLWRSECYRLKGRQSGQWIVGEELWSMDSRGRIVVNGVSEGIGVYNMDKWSGEVKGGDIKEVRWQGKKISRR